MAEDHGTARVLITSIDGNITHPFRWNQTIGDVRTFGYERLVKDKNQVPIANTWIEFGNERQDNGRELSTLMDPKKQPGKEIDITLNLAWTQQGGNASNG